MMRNFQREVQQQLDALSVAAASGPGTRTQEFDHAYHDSTRIFPKTQRIFQEVQTTDLRPIYVAPPGYQVGHEASGSSSSETRRREPIVSSYNFFRDSENLDTPYQGPGYEISADTSAGNSRICRCRTVFKSLRWKVFSSLQFSQTYRTQHCSFCPKYSSSEQCFELATRLVPPPWLLSYTISLGFQVKNWSTIRPLSISPIVVGTCRLVDRSACPAFRAVDILFRS